MFQAPTPVAGKQEIPATKDLQSALRKGKYSYAAHNFRPVNLEEMIFDDLECECEDKGEHGEYREFYDVDEDEDEDDD